MGARHFINATTLCDLPTLHQLISIKGTILHEIQGTNLHWLLTRNGTFTEANPQDDKKMKGLIVTRRNCILLIDIAVHIRESSNRHHEIPHCVRFVHNFTTAIYLYTITIHYPECHDATTWNGNYFGRLEHCDWLFLWCSDGARFGHMF